jgi:hypothetical protein
MKSVLDTENHGLRFLLPSSCCPMVRKSFNAVNLSKIYCVHFCKTYNVPQYKKHNKNIIKLKTVIKVPTTLPEVRSSLCIHLFMYSLGQEAHFSQSLWSYTTMSPGQICTEVWSQLLTLRGTCSTTWTTSKSFFALIVLESQLCSSPHQPRPCSSSLRLSGAWLHSAIGWNRVSWTICPGWPGIMNLLISASQLIRITSGRHCRHPSSWWIMAKFSQIIRFILYHPSII